MRTPRALISGINQKGSQRNDQGSEEMQICIFCSQSCNSLPASQNLHVITELFTRIGKTDTCEVFSALPRGKRTYRSLIFVKETNIDFPSVQSIRTCITS